MDSYIVVAVLIVVLAIAICVLDHNARRTRELADDFCRRAANLTADMDTMEGYLVEIREQLSELSKTLNKIERDVD